MGPTFAEPLNKFARILQNPKFIAVLPRQNFETNAVNFEEKLNFR
jgi:hypothetical protein